MTNKFLICSIILVAILTSFIILEKNSIIKIDNRIGTVDTVNK